MFDYVSDEELTGTYNSISYSKVDGYTDPYTSLNTAISQSLNTSIKHNGTNNITITFERINSADTLYDSDVYVYLWQNSNNSNNNSWPGQKMIYDSASGKYTLTVNRTDSSSPYYLSFNPDRVIFNNGSNAVQTDTIDPGTMTAGHTYNFKEGSSTDSIKFIYATDSNHGSSLYLYLWNGSGNFAGWPGTSVTTKSKNDTNPRSSYNYNYEINLWKNNSPFIPTNYIVHDNSDWRTEQNLKQTLSPGWTYFVDGAGNVLSSYPKVSYVSSTNSAQNIYNCAYTNPLYFGCFLQSNDVVGSYTSSTVPSYNNFYWLPNMAPRTHYDVSVQGLVNGTLSGGSYTGNLLDTDGSTTLPYLNADWADSNPSLVKYYNKDGNGNQLAFPFYEVRAGANQSAVSKSATGSNISSEYAKFYQFNSAETSLRFDIAKTSGTIDPSLHKGDFIETSVAKSSSLNQVGFFPFESANHKNQNNLGFGTKVEMEFKLQADGCVNPVDSSGAVIPYNENTGNTTRIDSIFEFEGDDDLWVFIDGKLVLDMGGDHGKSTGSINFAKRKVTADTAIALTNDNKYNLGVSGTAIPVQNTNVGTGSETYAFTDLLSDAAYYRAHGEYNPNTIHTMTIFYMERGMNDSNLLIRYNYATISNSSKMKVQEITDFSSVNDGLLAYTQKAADKDVFEYTVYNKATDSNDVKDSDAAYPTTVSHIRNNYYDPDDSTVYQSTPLTPNGTETSSVSNFSPSGTNTFDTVANTTYAWVDKFANMYSASKGGDGKGAGKTDANGKLYIMYGTADTESSAEFEKQFSKYSYMRIIQGDNLYRQGSASSGGSTYYTLNNSSGRTLSDYYTLTRVHTLDAGQEVVNDLTTTYKADPTAYSFQFVNDASVSSNVATMMTEYFTNTVKVGAIQVTKNLDPDDNVQDEFEFQVAFTNVFGVTDNNVTDHSGITISGTSDGATTLTSDGKFKIKKGNTATIIGIPVGTHYVISETSPSTNYQFKEVSSGSLTGDKTQSTQTATVVNTRLTGSLTITKNVVNTPSRSSFTFDVTLTQPTGVNLGNYTIKQDGVDMSSQPQSGTSFPVTVNLSGTTGSVTLSGIPYGTTYSVSEQVASQAGTVTDGVDVTYGETSAADQKIGAGTSGGSHTVMVTNTYPSVTPVTVHKTGGNDTEMAGAELELWYRENQIPPTYSPNEPQTAPAKAVGQKITTDTSITLPPDEQITSTTPPIVTKTVTYKADTTPTASDKDWILPRNDTDYIYFRDYNDGTGYYGDEDLASFSATAVTNAQSINGQPFPASQSVGSNGTYSQQHKSSWLYTYLGHENSSDQNQDLEIRYNKDHYRFTAQFTKNNGQNFVEYSIWERFVDVYNGENTVVWKVQPPDGYTEVRFALYHDNTCIRTTKRINFTLGDIYHKTNWGTYYEEKNNGADKCYYDVPITKETDWAVHGTPTDLRQSGNGMEQAKKYEPTEQKIIFHCNSTEVWHNIHIEFFTDENGEHPINGQQYPGYMMEPYSHAPEYRINGYLTYELTIPNGAHYFRINNGVDTSKTYGFQTAITPIKDATTGNGAYANIKNYANYYKFDNYSAKTLTRWTDGPEGANPGAVYDTVDVESDYDFIYFEVPSNWTQHVYAYFYGGGELRKDNWQRACYSSWPGIAPVGTEFTEGSTEYHSTTYSYSQTGNQFNSTSDPTTWRNPETSFMMGGKRIVKFRLPEGDRGNYGWVIFNDGLDSQKTTSVTNETRRINYQPGYLYRADGSSKRHYESNPTATYTARTNNSGYDYLYVKTTDITTWDDLHIKFFNKDGVQIHQSKHGYVMEYAGKSGATPTYFFRIPIPTDAVQFSVNNGMGKSTELETGKYDIMRKSTIAAEPAGSVDYTTGDIVYSLAADKTMVQTGPTFEETETVTESVTLTGSQDDRLDVATRSDKLKIYNDAQWSGLGIGTAKVKFYDASGSLIKPASGASNVKGNGTYILIKSDEDANGKSWYSINIPTNAVSFTMSYGTKTTAQYPIYQYSANGTGLSTNWTNDGMYYKTNTNGTLSLIDSTVQDINPQANDETYEKRGDDLYLIADTKADRTVTFYGGDGTAIFTDITAKYISEDANSKYWYRVSIPKSAAAFTVTTGANTTAQADIYPLKNLSRYEKDYTTGDMQYALSSENTLSIVYPIYTEDPEYTGTAADGSVISSRGVPQADASKVSGYASDPVGITPATTAETVTPVLYNTSTDNITYSWSEGSGTTTQPVNNNIWFDDSNTGWGGSSNTIKIIFSDSVGSGANVTGSMNYDNSTGLYYYAVPTNDNYCSVEIYQSGNHSSKFVTLSNQFSSFQVLEK